jgi:hypothetical protein
VVHRGGFGTCVPGAWSGHTHQPPDGGARYPTQSTARGPRSSLGSAAWASPGTRRECPRRTNSARTTSSPVTRTCRRTVIRRRRRIPCLVRGRRSCPLEGSNPTFTGCGRTNRRLRRLGYAYQGKTRQGCQGMGGPGTPASDILNSTTSCQPPAPAGPGAGRIDPKSAKRPLPHRPNDSGPSRDTANQTGPGPKHAKGHDTLARAQDSLNRNWTARSPRYRTLDGAALHNSDSRSSSLEYSSAIQNSKSHAPVDGSLQQLCADPLLARVDSSLGSTFRTQGLLRQISQPFAPSVRFTHTPPMIYTLLHLHTTSFR